MNAPEQSPAGKVFDEAIELALEERSPYPESAMFLDADCTFLDEEMKRAAVEGYAVVLVSADGTTEIIPPKSPSEG